MSRRTMASPISRATGSSRSGVPPLAGPDGRPRRRKPRLLLAYCAVAALLTGGLVAAFTGDESTATEAADSTNQSTAAPPPSTIATGPDCSMPVGNQDSGEGVIAAFEHAYYVERSGTAAHSFVSTDAPTTAPFTVVANLDAGIATVPPRTTYCLDIVALHPGLYSMTLTEGGPSGPGTQYRQHISTSETEGQHFIDSVEPA